MRRARSVRAFLAVAAALALPPGCSTEGSPTPGRRQQALEAPGRDVVYAASSWLRVIEGSTIRARINLGRTVNQIAFDPQGARAFLATSDGVHVFDAQGHRELRHLTSEPARSVVVAPTQGKLYVLENSVERLPDGRNQALPFRLRRFDLERLSQEHDIEIGERILAVGVPSSPSARMLVVSENGALALLGFPRGTAEPLGVPGEGGRVRVGPILGRDGHTVYLPVEGADARVIAVDVRSGTVETIPLGRDAYLRALSTSPDGKRLYVNALTRVAVVELGSSGNVRWGELGAPHQSLGVSPDGERLYLARPVHAEGGSVTVVDATTLELEASIPLPDISPFTLAVRP